MGLAEFFGTSRSNSGVSAHLFPEIDINGMAKRLRLKARAKERGESNVPKADSQGFDAVEQEIVNEIESEKMVQYDDYLEQQKTYADRAHDSAIRRLVFSLHDRAADAVADFRRETHSGTGELYSSKREVIQTERELGRYRDQHRLERPPRHYSKRSLKVGVLLMILAVEAVLNGSFLAKGSVFGLAGGVFEALIIAAINVVVGCGVGRLVVPWIGHRNRLAGLLGLLGLIAYIALAIGFNLAVAHYRSAIVSDPFEASLLAYRSLIADPLAISDLQSWALFVVGIIFSAFAAVDGWLMDDPYPGYGQRMRHNLEALEAYNNFKHELLEDLEQIKKRAEREMDAIGDGIQGRQEEFRLILLRSDALRATVKQHFSHLESAGNTLLKIYRDENMRFRTEPAPERFDNAGKWTIELPRTDEETPAIEAPDHSDEAVQESLRSVPARRGELHQAYQRSLDEYKRIDDLVSLESPP